MRRRRSLRGRQCLLLLRLRVGSGSFVRGLFIDNAIGKRRFRLHVSKAEIFIERTSLGKKEFEVGFRDWNGPYTLRESEVRIGHNHSVSVELPLIGKALDDEETDISEGHRLKVEVTHGEGGEVEASHIIEHLICAH